MMSNDSTSNKTGHEGTLVIALSALSEGDVVTLADRDYTLTVTDARRNQARLEGPRGGSYVLTDWESTEHERGEHGLSRRGGSAIVRCVERADGTTPTDEIGMELDTTTPTGGFSTAFTTGADL